MEIMQIRERVYDAVNSLINTKKYSPQQLATHLSISTANISLLKNRKADKMADKTFILLYNNPVLGIVRQQIIETPNFNQIVKIAKHCIEEGSKKLVYGRTGFGKTTVLKHIMSSGVLGGNCFYLLCNKMMSRKRFVIALADSMGIKTQRKVTSTNKWKDRSEADIFEEIIEKLMNSDNALLMFDDAGKLKNACHEAIQIIEDRTKGMVGVLLTYTDQYFYEKLQRMNSGEIRSWIGFPEYFSRFTFIQKLYGPSEKDVELLCEKEGIGQHFEKVMNTIKVTFGDKDSKQKPKESDAAYNSRIAQCKWSGNPAENEVDYRQITAIISNIIKIINQDSQTKQTQNNG